MLTVTLFVDRHGIPALGLASISALVVDGCGRVNDDQVEEDYCNDGRVGFRIVWSIVGLIEVGSDGPARLNKHVVQGSGNGASPD